MISTSSYSNQERLVWVEERSVGQRERMGNPGRGSHIRGQLNFKAQRQCRKECYLTNGAGIAGCLCGIKRNHSRYFIPYVKADSS